MNWKKEWDLQILLNLSLSEKEAGELAYYLEIDDSDLPDPRGLPDLVFVFDEDILDAWKKEKYDAFRNDAIRHVVDHQEQLKLNEWQRVVEKLDSWHRQIEQVQDDTRKRTGLIENNIRWNVGIQSDQIPAQLQELEEALERDADYWAALSVDQLEANEEGLKRIEMDSHAGLLQEWMSETHRVKQIHAILREIVRVKILYEFKGEVLRETIRDYESTGVIPDKKSRIKTRKSTRSVQRVRNAVLLLTTEREQLTGKSELQAALSELEKSQVADPVKQLDKVIGYTGEGGNDERLSLCIAFLELHDPKFLKEPDK